MTAPGEDRLSEMEKVQMGLVVPSWACKRWPEFEHDWMGCSDCLDAYEAGLEAEKRAMKQLPAKVGSRPSKIFVRSVPNVGETFLFREDYRGAVVQRGVLRRIASGVYVLDYA